VAGYIFSSEPPEASSWPRIVLEGFCSWLLVLVLVVPAVLIYKMTMTLAPVDKNQ